MDKSYWRNAGWKLCGSGGRCGHNICSGDGMRLITISNEKLLRVTEASPDCMAALRTVAQEATENYMIFDIDSPGYKSFAEKHRGNHVRGLGGVTLLVAQSFFRCESYDGPARGVGDLIARATSAVGIKPCEGCKKRRKKLNQLVPFR